MTKKNQTLLGAEDTLHLLNYDLKRAEAEVGHLKLKVKES